MSKCPIGFGYSKFYWFVFGTAFLRLLKCLLFSISPYHDIEILTLSKLSEHIIIQSLYKYISFIIGSLLSIYIIKKNTKGERNKNNPKKNLKIKGLIYNDKKYDLKKNKVFETFLVCFIFFSKRIY